jgi:hypothetical protein
MSTYVRALSPANTEADSDVIPLSERSSVPPCVGQEPERTSGAPA